jgi:hypothetical protein
LLAHFNRYLWNTANLLVITGESKKIDEGRTAYNQRYGIRLSSPNQEAQLERLMAAVGLAAVSLAERESWGFSMTLRGSNVGFFCAVEPEGLICGQMRPAQSLIARAVVQRKKNQEPLTQSSYEPEGQDPVRAVQEYFEKATQISTRISVTPDGRGALLQTLPGSTLDFTVAASDDQIVELVEQKIETGELKLLDEVLLFYECRCSDEMILDILTGLPEDKRAELWQDAEQLEVECPRCGREYVLRKQVLSPKVTASEPGTIAPTENAETDPGLKSL